MFPPFEGNSREQEPASGGFPYTAPQPARSISTSFAWGIIGSNRYGLLRDQGCCGIIRTEVEENVDYQKPPLPPESPTWTRWGSQYEMKLDQVNYQAVAGQLSDLGVSSLVEFREQLVAAQQAADQEAGTLPPGGSKGKGYNDRSFIDRMAELDRFAIRLLDLVEHLHSKGCRLGLLRPPGILLRDDYGELQIILPDLGFVATESGWGLAIDWIDEQHPLVQQWRELWDPGNIYTLQGITDVGKFTDEIRASDLRTVARLFSWLLLGKVCRHIPTRDEEEKTYAPVWNLLQEVVEGGIISAAVLRERLAQPENYLSRHFFPDPPRPKKAPWSLISLVRPGSRPALFGAATLLALGLVVGGSWWGFHYLGVTHNRNEEYNSAQNRLTSDKTLKALPVESRLVKYQREFETTSDLTDRFSLLVRMYRDVRPALDIETRQLENQHREKHRHQFVTDLVTRLDQLFREAEENYSRIPVCLRETERMRDQLIELQDIPTHKSLQEEEARCLKICRDWIAKVYATYSD